MCHLYSQYMVLLWVFPSYYFLFLLVIHHSSSSSSSQSYPCLSLLNCYCLFSYFIGCCLLLLTLFCCHHHHQSSWSIVCFGRLFILYVSGCCCCQNLAVNVVLLPSSSSSRLFILFVRGIYFFNIPPTISLFCYSCYLLIVFIVVANICLFYVFPVAITTLSLERLIIENFVGLAMAAICCAFQKE